LNRRLKINISIIATLAVIFGTAMTSTNSAWAATINCPNVPPPNPPGTANCVGTDNPDTILGTANEDFMIGQGGDDKMFGFARNDVMDGGTGDDTMSGGSGDDNMFGGNGDDNMNGDSGNDIVIGFRGADILKGSSGNDEIYHFGKSTPISESTLPDGSKDTIDCGSGNDEAWINISQDHDTADSNCETVHSDINP
jgi:Ca2+-binding RTX toxin-like protein